MSVFETGSESATAAGARDWRRVAYLVHVSRALDHLEETVLVPAKKVAYQFSARGHDLGQVLLGLRLTDRHDGVCGYYRSRPMLLSLGVPLEEALGSSMARAGGYSDGRDIGVVFNYPNPDGPSALPMCGGVGSQYTPTAGWAQAIEYRSGRLGDPAFAKSIGVVLGGDASVATNGFWSALTIATTQRLPMLFYIEDNGYGISVPKRDQSANDCLADNFAGIKGARIWRVDGRDVPACFAAMHEAAQYARTGAGCAIVYAYCVRMGSHSNSDNHSLYRDEKELAEARARDPLPIFRRWLLENEHVSQEQLEAIENDARREFAAAYEYGENAPRSDVSTATQHVFAPAYTPEARYAEGLPDAADTKLVEHFEAKKGQGLTLRQGINAALRREFRDNPDTFLWGQDIANKEKEGIFLVTKGMQAEFGPKRVFNAPIAENYIVGTANGFSRFDPRIRVVVEGAEFADYFWVAMDQYVECSHDYYRTRGQFAPNVIIRLASGGFIGGGLYHSQSIEGSLANIPGVRIVYPTFADDAYGLMRTAMKSHGPTVYLEPKALYNDPRTRAQVAEDFHVPFGKARVRREGSDVVVFSYGNTLMMALKAAEELAKGGAGVSVAVVDLRSLVPLDEETILHWVRKTGRAVVAHEGPEFGGFGGEVAALIAKKGFEYLDAPVERVGAKFSPVPFSTVLEAGVLPQPKDIIKAIETVAGY